MFFYKPSNINIALQAIFVGKTNSSIAYFISNVK